MKNILVVGGAGYIGSHIVRDLNENGYAVTVYDNLTIGHLEAIANTPFIHADINDYRTLDKTFTDNAIDAVIHLSACSYIGESLTNPEKYYNNNVKATLTLLSTMLKHNVHNFVFSSTCAIYGNPEYTPIDEFHPQKPISPYGLSKLIIEQVLNDYSNAYGLKYIALRYFNAAGAHADATIGESHTPETHLIPLTLKTLTKERDYINIFGVDYDTPDGTCVRDYIHVCDLAVAHRLALEKLCAGNDSYCINLGTGIGVSVKDIVIACENVTGMKVPVVLADRHVWDPPSLVATNDYAKKILGFEPKYTDILETIKTAWRWECNRRY